MCSETSAYKSQTPGNYPEEKTQHTEHGESLKSKVINFYFLQGGWNFLTISTDRTVTWRQGRTRRKLLDDLKERRGYSHLKKEALDRTMWRARFGRGFGPVVRQTAKWMNQLLLVSEDELSAWNRYPDCGVHHLSRFYMHVLAWICLTRGWYALHRSNRTL
jgi:hypothetical protein